MSVVEFSVPKFTVESSVIVFTSVKFGKTVLNEAVVVNSFVDKKAPRAHGTSERKSIF